MSKEDESFLMGWVMITLSLMEMGLRDNWEVKTNFLTSLVEGNPCFCCEMFVKLSNQMNKIILTSLLPRFIKDFTAYWQ